MRQAPVIVHGAAVGAALGAESAPGVRVLSSADPWVATAADMFVGLHGSGVVEGRFVSTVEDLSASTLERGLKDPGTLGSTMKGSLTLYATAAGRLVVLPDPLGAGLVFRYRGNGVDALSSDLDSLVRVLDRLGHPVRKSLAYVLLLAATGSGGLGQTPFEGVEVLAPGCWLEVGPSGVREVPYSDAVQLAPESDSYEHGLDRTVDDVLSNVRAASAFSADTKISHLTGGSDSRLVVAALRHAGVVDDFSCYCMGGPGDPDFEIASRVCAALPARMTEFSGYVEDNRSQSWQDFTVGALNATSGVLQTLATVWGVPTNTMVLSGGYGEFLRSFYNQGKEADMSPALLAEHMYGQFSLGQNDDMCIVAPPLKERLVGQLREAVDAGLDRGVSKDAVLDYIYMTGRNRFFVGEISRVLSTYSHRFDPLYSVSAARTALALPGRLRNANVFGLDLLRRLDPVLAAMPFDRERYTGVYEEERGPVTRVGLLDLQPVVLPRPSGLLPAGASPLAWRAPQPSAEQTVTARRLGMAPRLLANYDVVRQELPAMLHSIPTGDLREVLNVRLLQTYLQRPPTHRVIFRGLTNLYGGLSWYLHGDSLGQPAPGVPAKAPAS